MLAHVGALVAAELAALLVLSALLWLLASPLLLAALLLGLSALLLVLALLATLARLLAKRLLASPLLTRLSARFELSGGLPSSLVFPSRGSVLALLREATL